MGPLDQLRRAVMSGDQVDMDKHSIIISRSDRLDRKLPTNFHSMRGRGDAYPLEAVFFQYKNRDMLYNNYVQQCRKEGIAYVVAVDKKDMLAYLKGDIDTCAGLVSKRAAASTQSRLSKAASGAPPSSASIADPAKFHPPRHEPPSATERDTSTFASNRRKARNQRSLDSVLMVKDYDFSGLRDKISQHVSEAKRSKSENAGNKNSSTFDPRGDRYTSNEGRVWRETLGSDFQDLGIDMSGSFKEKPSQVQQNGASAEKRRQRPTSRTSTASEPSGKRPRLEPKDLIPIIIVPTGFSTLICHGNAVELLENGQFISIEELRRRKVAPVSKVSRVPATRIPGGNCSQAEYHLVFNPKRLTPSEWKRVVAVVCSGQEWQFKKWPIYDGDLQDLFRRVQGFYFHYDDTAPVKNAELWPIKRLKISRARRYTDSRVQAQFWNHLDIFLGRMGRHLRY